MGVLAEIQQLNAADRELEHQKVIRHCGRIRQFKRECRLRLKGLSRMGPSPQGPPLGRQGSPARFRFPDGQGRHLSAQPVLVPCFWKQPAELNLRLTVQFIGFGTAAIGEQLELIRGSPASEHQCAHPWCAVCSHRSQLQPTGRGLTTFPLARPTQPRAPGRKGHGW